MWIIGLGIAVAGIAVGWGIARLAEQLGNVNRTLRGVATNLETTARDLAAKLDTTARDLAAKLDTTAREGIGELRARRGAPPNGLVRPACMDREPATSSRFPPR